MLILTQLDIDFNNYSVIISNKANKKIPILLILIYIVGHEYD